MSQRQDPGPHLQHGRVAQVHLPGFIVWLCRLWGCVSFDFLFSMLFNITIIIVVVIVVVFVVVFVVFLGGDETGCHHMSQVGLELLIFLFPKCWDHRSMPLSFICSI